VHVVHEFQQAAHTNNQQIMRVHCTPAAARATFHGNACSRHHGAHNSNTLPLL
jgi:hypothetical protein